MSKSHKFFTLKVNKFFKVRNAKIRLSNLTIFVGENNLNKTWFAYLILTLLSDKHIANLFFKISKNNRYKLFKILSELYDKLLSSNHIDNNNFKENIRSLIEKFYEELAKKYCYVLDESFFKITKTQFNKGDIKISCKISQWSSINADKVAENLIRYFDLHIKNSKALLFQDFFNLFKLFKVLVKEFLKKNLAENYFYLPAERNALIQFANLISYGELNLYRAEENVISFSTLIKNLFPKIFNEENTETNVEDFLGERVRRETNYPSFIKEFIDFLFKIKDESIINKNINEELLKLLESVIEGKIIVDEIGALFYKEEVGTQEIPVKIASSMVKSLSGLNLFIKYKFIPNKYLLVIDEPEIALHPEAQVKLIEFLTILVNKGLKIILTTHSPYIVDHLINLMEGYKVKKGLTPPKLKDKLKELFWLPKAIEDLELKEIKVDDILINPSKVSVYWFKKDNDGYVKLKSIKNSNDTIDWQTFSKISEKLSEIYYAL